jgi:O-antigen/teichoic acid export membrane protein
MTTNATSQTSENTTNESWRKQEVRIAVTNGLKLGSSLILTWTIALIARLYIPRFLGPARFGALNFAEAFATTAFVLIGFGLDTYVRKEIAVRPKHANDFIGGIVTLRILLLFVVYVGMEAVLRATHCTPETKALVYIFGAGQFFMVGANTSAGLLHAAGKVGEMSILSVIVKVAWGICIFFAVFFKLNMWAFALVFTISEGIKAFVLFALAKKHLALEFRIDVRATAAVLLAALPFFVSGLATTIYDKIGVNLLEFMTNRNEVGWYGAANGLAGLVLLLVPLLSWIVVPLFARSVAQSEDELFRIVRRALEFVLLVTMPVAMILMVGADFWVTLLFGRAFAPAALALRVLAATTFLMYVSIIAAYALAVLNFTWSMSFVFLSGTIITPVCNLFLIPRFSSHGVAGAAGAACATATLITEIAIVSGLLSRLGKRSFDIRLVLVLAKCSVSFLTVVIADRFLWHQLGFLRLILDFVLYVIQIVALRAIVISELIEFIREMASKKLPRGTDSNK